MDRFQLLKFSKKTEVMCNAASCNHFIHIWPIIPGSTHIFQLSCFFDGLPVWNYQKQVFHWTIPVKYTVDPHLLYLNTWSQPQPSPCSKPDLPVHVLYCLYVLLPQQNQPDLRPSSLKCYPGMDKKI